MNKYITAVFAAALSLPASVLMAQSAGGSDNGFIRIAGGTFTMGSPAAEAGRQDDEAQHSVTVDGFYLAEHQVTQEDYEALMGNNPSWIKGQGLPVEQVTWLEAVQYCNALSVQEGLVPAYTVNGSSITWNREANGYRLPTEAEWEYACRAGTVSAYSTGSSITKTQANYEGRTTTPPGSFAPNPWGLYDMHGNVWEWVWDWYGPYTPGSRTNPGGSDSGTDRVMRGGSWAYKIEDTRSARRGHRTPNTRICIGFRLARNAP
ncbi:formylglycine-generating enzyme family protein [Breznakiella homolactica]|uniref:Formylglycine-generating enzyme family protein n=1 Tax=Breznakiella homolactica TaxID=2798577 RepID=A0A7T8B8Y1_9SPIR|nr:formylglycine-generating enzyme family protein [Breznakiella homolactica]QQO07791.1 formylglycine-generating enzyme family protein [Breznakiella homolactica]